MILSETYTHDGALIEYLDDDGFHVLDGGKWTTRPHTPEEAALVAAEKVEAARTSALTAHRDALAAARAILLDYRYGAPGTPTFPEVLSPVQTAVIDYRDSGIKDAECDEHIMWINARVNEINASALYGAGVLK